MKLHSIWEQMTFTAQKKKANCIRKWLKLSAETSSRWKRICRRAGHAPTVHNAFQMTANALTLLVVRGKHARAAPPATPAQTTPTATAPYFATNLKIFHFCRSARGRGRRMSLVKIPTNAATTYIAGTVYKETCHRNLVCHFTHSSKNLNSDGNQYLELWNRRSKIINTMAYIAKVASHSRDQMR